MTKVEKATAWMINLANDNSHGYAWGGWGPQDYDCGHAIITAWEQAGVPVKSRGATYTGNMRAVFLACGFEDVTSSIILGNGEGLKRGDVLLNESSHAAMAVDRSRVVHARSGEGNNIPGDQSGNEIRIQPYFNYPWNVILRYPETAADDEAQPEESDEEENPDIVHPTKRRTYLHLEFGDGCRSKGQLPLPQVKAWQNLLICWGLSVGVDGADGEYGINTQTATREWQEKAKTLGADVEVNGVVDEDDWIEAVNVPVE